MKQPPPVVLSVGGYDPSGGAGVTADVKTIAAHGCYAISCITAVTVQTTVGVRKVVPLDPELVCQTLFDLAADMPIAAVRIGMLGSGAVAAEVAAFLESARPPNVVLDPIIVSSSGARLLDCPGEAILRDRLLPLATVVTPNAAEASALTGTEVRTADQARAAGRKLLQMSCRNVVVTGGHLADNADLLFWIDGSGSPQEQSFTGQRVQSNATHGTGCAFASALACNLATGKSVPEAVRLAKDYVRQAIEHAYPLGRGKGPMNHLFDL
jgi:hydroxymethylpyrimidine/phosphomethylpyrimidine kinase